MVYTSKVKKELIHFLSLGVVFYSIFERWSILSKVKKELIHFLSLGVVFYSFFTASHVFVFQKIEIIKFDKCLENVW